MIIKRISIYDEFKCIGAECPVNCCKGWRVPLDEAICEKYLSKKKVLGLRFHFFVNLNGDVPTFRNVFGRCPFWGKDHLCKIQKEHGEEYMAAVCRQFPRRLYNLGFFSEETLYLACPEAARLFLSHTKKGEHFDFGETEGEITYEVNTTNDDEDFLSYLRTAREQLIGMLGEGCCFDSMAILRYGRGAQEACLRGESCPSPLLYKDTEAPCLLVDCAVLNELFFNGFYHPYLKANLPFLHQLCGKYIREFALPAKVNMGAANRKLMKLKKDLYDKVPELELIFNRYYEYYLQLKFLDIFEDYSFLRCLTYGMAKVHMLWVLMALYAQNKEYITDDEISKIIAVFERRAPQMKEALAKILPM